MHGAFRVTRVAVRRAGARLRAGAGGLLQATGAAAAAWWIAHDAIGHARPFFAPVAAIVALASEAGYRGRRATELLLGVIVGIAVGDATVRVAGHGVAQLAFAVLVALAVPTAAGATRVVVVQAAVSAVLIVALPAPLSLPPGRLVDAVVGGGVAIVVSQLLFPVDPVRLVRHRFDPFAQELAAACELLAVGAERRNGDCLTRAVDGLASIGSVRIEEVLDAARGTASRAPRRRRQRRRIDGYAHAAVELEAASHDLLLLAKTLQHLAADGAPAGDVGPSLRRLGRVVAALPAELASSVPAEDLTAAVADARQLARAARADGEATTVRVVANDLMAFADDVARAADAVRTP